MRATEDYRIQPHPDGLNKIVTMQFYLPEGESQLDLNLAVCAPPRYRQLT